MRIRDLIPDREALISPDFYRRKNLLVQVIEEDETSTTGAAARDRRSAPMARRATAAPAQRGRRRCRERPCSAPAQRARTGEQRDGSGRGQAGTRERRRRCSTS